MGRTLVPVPVPGACTDHSSLIHSQERRDWGRVECTWEEVEGHSSLGDNNTSLSYIANCNKGNRIVVLVTKIRIMLYEE